MTFADLNNKFPGSTVTICGTGPSLDHLDDKTITGPRIYLNRAAFALPYSEGETFWLVMDDAWGKQVKGPWHPFLSSVKFGCGVTGVFLDYLLGSGHKPPAPTGKNIIHFADPKGEREKLLGMDRDAVAEAGQLYMFAGTGCTAVHLAWYMGAAKVRLAGMDGGDGYAKRLARFYEKDRKGGSGYQMARQCAMKVANVKGLAVEEVTAPAKASASPT